MKRDSNVKILIFPFNIYPFFLKKNRLLRECNSLSNPTLIQQR